MRGVIGVLALVIAIPFGLIVFQQLMTLVATDVTTVSGGAGSMFGQIPTLFVYITSGVMAVLAITGIVAFFLR
jgi:hypothetical protein